MFCISFLREAVNKSCSNLLLLCLITPVFQAEFPASLSAASQVRDAAYDSQLQPAHPVTRSTSLVPTNDITEHGTFSLTETTA